MRSKNDWPVEKRKQQFSDRAWGSNHDAGNKGGQSIFIEFVTLIPLQSPVQNYRKKSLRKTVVESEFEGSLSLHPQKEVMS